MKHKTAELTGALLDAAVALAEGLPFKMIEDGKAWLYLTCLRTASVRECPQFSTQWGDGGPIIERGRISLLPPGYGGAEHWTAGVGVRNSYDGWEADHEAEGPTPLIAAMRAFVASKLGFEVELP